MFILILAVLLQAQSNEDCFACHSDNSLTAEKNGKEVSLFIDPQLFSASPHQNLNCVDCHRNFDPEEIPHSEVLWPVDCSGCHSDEARVFSASSHATKLECTSCHTRVHAPQSRVFIAKNCEICHKKESGQVRQSIHGEKVETPSCVDCHSSHSVKIVSSQKCLACHGKKEFVHKSIKHENLEFVLKYKESIHVQFIECSDCHTGHNIQPADSLNSSVNRRNIEQTCTRCHQDIEMDFVQSEHSRALREGFEGAPTCTDCHGEHGIHQITDLRSPVARANEIEVCEDCHLDSPEVARRMTHSVEFVAAYEKSIHGKLFVEGNTDVAICSDCHTAHGEKKASDPTSTVNTFNIPETCGNCHADVEHTYSQSIHGKALAEGVQDAPSCVDCHGEHKIIEPSSPESPVSPLKVSQDVCGPCHQNVKMSEKFGLPTDRYKTYSASFHGLAVKFGKKEAANCASCHGYHDVLPSSDPDSKTNPGNLPTTCGQCHPGANENFARGEIHMIRSPQGEKISYWISRFYIILIIVTISTMAFHNIIDWIRKTIIRYRAKYKKLYVPKREKSTRLYLRMTVNERIQHLLLAISFLTLVFTGFMLKYPDSFWVVGFRKLGGELVFEVRGLLHRFAAVVMILDAVYHLYYVVFTQRGRKFIKDIMFRFKDIRDMIQMFKYNMGMTTDRPQFGRFNYIEKAEYWALIWGTIIMAVTGIALWFNEKFMGWFSLTFIDIAGIIHFYEAWLAFLAILVWHFYYVIFNPDVYPMNFTWLTGKITEEEMEHEHPLELAEIKRKQDKNIFSQI